MNTQITARILADSIGPHGIRLTTFETTIPRIVLADMRTHRMLSYSAESSRAVPHEVRIDQVINDPFVPKQFYERGKGMTSGPPLPPRENRRRQAEWLVLRWPAIEQAKKWLKIDKQYALRPLEPWAWWSVIVSGTDWENFFNLRVRGGAQPELQEAASIMETLRITGTPDELDYGEVHAPLVMPEERDLYGPRAQMMMSAGRCARTSFNKQSVAEPGIEGLSRTERLVGAAHWSPLEHPAICQVKPDYIGNYRGWKQLRKTYDNEAVAP